MKRLLLFSACIVVSLVAICQPPEHDTYPQRKPEEEARKQTEMLVRELGITDSVKIDTLYRVHLKYACLRRNDSTRSAEVERLQSLYAELKQMLTKQQYEQFMSHLMRGPRRPQQPYCRMPQDCGAARYVPLDGGPSKSAAPAASQ